MGGSALCLGLTGVALFAVPPAARSVPLDRLGTRFAESIRVGRGRHRPAVPVAPSRLAGLAGRARSSLPRFVVGVATGAVVVALTGPRLGLPLGALAGWGAGRWARRLRPPSERNPDELPGLLDLLAVCLRAGLPPVSALDVVARALPGPLSTDLLAVAGLHTLGAGPAAWNDLRDDPVLGPVARAAIRSGESGSALAVAFERLAAEQRASTELDAQARARRAGVLAMVPLGLCFLPAFVCLGVVPVVVGLARQILGGTGPALSG